jgi:hypothetical protein
MGGGGALRWRKRCGARLEKEGLEKKEDVCWSSRLYRGYSPFFPFKREFIRSTSYHAFLGV